jgi:hypothetical protein
LGERLTLQIIVEEGEGDLVPSLVFLEDGRVGQVCARGHPAVDLVREGLDVLRYLEVGLVLLDVVRRLVLGRQNAHGDLDLLRVGRVQHGRMALDRGLELGLLACDERGYLATPAVAQDTPAADVWIALRRFLDDFLDLWQVQGGSGLGLEEVAELLSLFAGVRWIPGNVGRLALEEVGHEDLVLVFFVRMGEDISALDCLGEEAENIVYGKDGLGGIGWPGDICAERKKASSTNE